MRETQEAGVGSPSPSRGSDRAIAHVSSNGRLHDLEDHLRGTATRAGQAGDTFGSKAWAELAGLWHDLGKYSAEFQEMIRTAAGINAHIETSAGAPQGKVDHSTAGALFAREQIGKGLGLPLAFVIAGHHAGLADKEELRTRLDAKFHYLERTLKGGVPESIRVASRLSPPAFLRGQADPERSKRSYEFWVRMLFSALVDADFLDTEAFHDLSEGNPRVAARGTGESLQALRERFDVYMAEKRKNAPQTIVNHVRDQILSACRQAGSSLQGIFSLTAPTGGGKTLATMAFALEHALHHALRRVIVVIPYTSIIEQNAKVYREALGNENVVEHHASLDPEEEDFRNRIACENWDAPVVVTTNVQFFESLLANRTSHCRKLHNIAKSVVIFDEVQMFPPHHLAVILDLLNELVAHYRVSLLLSTATQPALQERALGGARKFPGLKEIREILPEPVDHFKQLRRAEIKWPDVENEPKSWEDLAREIERHPRVLVIVHKRQDARELARLLPAGAFHLSTLMCAKHRSDALGQIRVALEGDHEVRVVSTQLVEAGVDLDFPVVYRALGGLEAIAQAAGRCNREGSLDGPGKVYIYVPPSTPPRGILRSALEVTKGMLQRESPPDPLTPNDFHDYFRQLYGTQDLDRDGVQREREGWKFKTVADTFRMIDDGGRKPVVVPYNDVERRLEELKFAGPSRKTLRALQPYIVEIYRPEFRELEKKGALQLIDQTLWAIEPGFAHVYDARFGLLWDPLLYQSPESLVI